MSRDELIEELKKAPANGEVKISLHITPDFTDKAFFSRKHTYKQNIKVDRVTVIPEIIIEALL